MRNLFLKITFLMSIAILFVSLKASAQVYVECNQQFSTLSVRYLRSLPIRPFPATISGFSGQSLKNLGSKLVQCADAHCETYNVVQKCSSKNGSLSFSVEIAGHVYNKNQDGHCGAMDPYTSLKITRSDGAVIFNSNLEQGVNQQSCTEINSTIDLLVLDMTRTRLHLETLTRTAQDLHPVQ